MLPGMQSAFVDLGLERDTFLYVSDFFEENEDIDRIPGGTEDRVSRERGERPERPERIDRPPAIVREPPAPVVVVEPEEQPAVAAAPLKLPGRIVPSATKSSIAAAAGSGAAVIEAVDFRIRSMLPRTSLSRSGPRSGPPCSSR